MAARLAAQNALFAEQFEDDMRASPESETASGDYRENALLDDYSLAASMKQNAVDHAYRAKLEAISTEGFPEQDRFSHDLLLHVLDNRIADYALKDYEMPISQMQGIHNRLADLPNSVPLDTSKHYEDYIARLHQIPRAFEQTFDVFRQGERDGLMPPRILLEQIPAQCEGTIAENPFLAPTKKFPASISAGDRQAESFDFVKLGQLFVNKGRWNGRQVVSRQWSERATQPHASINGPDDYGYGWWINTYTIGEKRYRSFIASGNGGQFVVVIPQLDLVVAFTAGNCGGSTVKT